MGKGLAGWLGFAVLAALVFVSSCQAWQAGAAEVASDMALVETAR